MWIDTTPPKSFKKDDVERYPTAGRRHGTARHGTERRLDRRPALGAETAEPTRARETKERYL